ncbi:unnamed protein product [Rhizopus microsporus]
MSNTVILIKNTKKRFEINLKKEQHIRDYVHHITQTQSLPPYYSISLLSLISSALLEINQIEYPVDKNKKKSFLNAYQSTTLAYNNKPEEDIFPRAYHTLVHCPVPNLFDTLLELESSYTLAIQELYASRDHELANIKARHAKEIESSSANMTSLFTRHVEELELFEATWQSDILQLQQTQRQEYREFVIELYREYQNRSEEKPDGKEMVEAAASRVKAWDHPDTGSLHSSSSSKRRASSILSNGEYTESVKSIQEMGFAKDQAETALMLSNQSVEAAIALLLENRAKVDAHIPLRRSIQTTRSRSNSSIENKRHSLQRASSLGNTNKTGKSWNPISFLQQQKHAMENTHLSSVRKLGGWLGKAMENLGIEEDKPKPAPPLAESFTIMMGTAQVKSTHNLRLLVTDQVIPCDPLRDVAYRAETATKLYTSHLSATVVLVDLNDLRRQDQPAGYGWRQYKAGKAGNQSLFERCQQSTEFHFADIETQLSVIQQDFECHPEGLQEGSFFVTKHSNLPNIQVVFHLVIDSTSISTLDVSNRHSVILGLRSILKLTSQYDISSLSIPLSLLPDKFLVQPEQIPNYQLWLQKRGEVVMKCIKGYLIEHSQSGKRVLQEENNLGLRTIEFILPPISNHMDDVSQQDVLFQQFRNLLVNLFRTS